MTNPKFLPLMTHLVELRKRLIIIFVALIIGMGVAWHLSPEILKFIEKPLTGNTYLTFVKKDLSEALERKFPAIYKHFNTGKNAPIVREERKLNYSAPLEPFFVQCKISLIAGLFLVLPLVFYQGWRAAEPLLKIRKKGLILLFALCSSLSFCLGTAFFLTVIWPVIINFSLSYETAGLMSWFNLSTYVNFCMRLILIFGLIFQLPVVAMLLSRLGLLSGRMLAKNRKYALLASAVISAFHADLLTMAVVMIPLYLMYEVSVWVAYLFAKEKRAESPLLDEPLPISQAAP